MRCMLIALVTAAMVGSGPAHAQVAGIAPTSPLSLGEGSGRPLRK
jgi:hypothetical protein